MLSINIHASNFLYRTFANIVLYQIKLKRKDQQEINVIFLRFCDSVLEALADLRSMKYLQQGNFVHSETSTCIFHSSSRVREETCLREHLRRLVTAYLLWHVL